MMRLSFVLAALGGGLLLVLSLAVPRGEASPAAAPGGCTNLLRSEPIVVWDVSGFTLGGAVHQHLVVYNNGLAAVSRASGSPTAGSSSADFKFLQQQTALKLLRDLYLAGAFELCDDPTPLSDAPLQTVTVLRGDTTAPSHSFSYWFPGTPELAEVAQILSDFKAEHFPGF